MTILIFGVGLFVINGNVSLDLGQELQRYNGLDLRYLIVVFAFVAMSYLFGYVASKKAMM